MIINATVAGQSGGSGGKVYNFNRHVQDIVIEPDSIGSFQGFVIRIPDGKTWADVSSFLFVHLSDVTGKCTALSKAFYDSESSELFIASSPEGGGIFDDAPEQPDDADTYIRTYVYDEYDYVHEANAACIIVLK